MAAIGGGSWHLLARYLGAQWPAVAALGVLLVAGSALQLANPQILRAFIDAATAPIQAGDAGGALGTLTLAAGLFFGVAVAEQIVAAGVTYFGENVAWRATNRLRADLALHCLRLDPVFHQTHPPGELIERLDGDVTALANFFSQFVLLVVANALFLAGMLVLLFREDWRIGVAVAVFMLVALVLLNRMQRRSVPLIRAHSQAGAALFAFLEERLAGIEDLQSRGAGAYVLRRFHQHARELFVAGRRAQLAASLPLNAAQAMFVLGNALALGLGAYLFRAGAITLGTVFLVYQYTNQLATPLRTLTEQLQDLQRATASIQRIAELAQEESAVRRLDDNRRAGVSTAAANGQDGWLGRNSSGGARPGPRNPHDEPAKLPAGAIGVAFEQVSFAYPTLARRPTPDTSAVPAAPATAPAPVLHNVSFRVEPGRVLGLLGRTGSGKSTIGRLLLRLYDPPGGAIRLADVDLRSLPLDDVRRRVGLVTQEVQLFHATVRDNLTVFDPSVSDARLHDVLEQVGLGPWLARQPAGLDSVLAAAGSGLSAGEAQLLAFARVFLRDPGLVILDEASSRLDPATEALVDRAVQTLLRDRTGIVIAHRLATVQRTDDVLILHDGHIVEHGPRTILAGDPTSRFAQLLRAGMEEALA